MGLKGAGGGADEWSVGDPTHWTKKIYQGIC